MATYSKAAGDWTGFYDDYKTTKQVGIGTLDYKLYSSAKYQKKKKKALVLGGITKIVYAGFDNDPMPYVLSFAFESQYQTIMGFNLRYIPSTTRTQLLDFIVKSNATRIKKKKPIIIDPKQLIKKFPQLLGCIRRYKIALIGVIENTPLIGWPLIAKESSEFSQIYKLGYKP